MKKSLIFTVLALMFACGVVEDKKTDGGVAVSSKTPCGALEAAPPDSLVPYHFWSATDTYGLNSFYIWEIDRIEGDGGVVYYFHGTERLVQDFVIRENWVVPPVLWSTMHMSYNGQDTYKFKPQDPFYLWYIPYVPDKAWSTKPGESRNDGTCPDNNTMINGRPRCIEVNQLDPRAPTLVAGKTYLVRMMMTVPWFDGDVHRQSCYQAILTP